MITNFTPARGICYLRSLSKHTSYGLKILNVSILGLMIAACEGAVTDNGDLPDISIVETTIPAPETTTSKPEAILSGSVGDGPITNAQIKITDSTGAVLGTAVSDTTASYTIDVPQGAAYPVVVEATGGTDMVSGTSPDFTLLSVALDSSANTVNINPFSTLIVKTAQSMAGGLTAGNIAVASQSIAEQLNFGLDPALVPDTVTTPINEANVAGIIKASEAFGETIRRTRSTLQVSGVSFSGDEIVDTIARDLTDGVMDGRGPGANAQVAAIANVVAGQVLVEALGNQLNVNGADATSLMDVAIKLSAPSATMTTSDVVITEGILNQARIAVAAAQTRSPSTNLSAVAVILAGLSGNSLAADNASALPADPGSSFNDVVTQMPLSTDRQLESVNATVRSGAFQFAAPTYSVGENDGTVNITINRIGGNSGAVTVEWRNLTFNGFGTADFANDYLAFPWTLITFADGETTRTLSITINQDSVVEDNETFSVLLQNPVGGALGGITTSVITIVDDDVASAPEPAPAPAEPAPAEPAPVPAPVASDRPWEDLLNSADLIGFGRKTTGGKGGEVCLVTNLNNTGSGSLRQCAESVGPRWIRFNLSGTINLSSKIWVTSNKTIDGRGQDITVRGQGLDIWTETNVIIHNIKIDSAAVDGIRINRGTTNVWIDHVTLTKATDERIDIGADCNDITISRTKFTGTGGYGVLVSPPSQYTGSTLTRVTLHHNHFDQIGERSPRVSRGKVHSFNNFYDRWNGGYAVGASRLSYLLSENNIWQSGTRTRGMWAQAMGTETEAPVSVKSVGEWLVNQVDIETRNPQGIQDLFNNPTSDYPYTLEAANSELMSNIVSNSGWQDIAAP